MSLLAQTAIFLGAAVVAVPVAKRLGLGAVLGYLAAGIIIGPSVLRLVTDVEGTLHFAEFGVVLLLFIIGLELQPTRLWALRKTVFGLGGAQVIVTSLLLGVAAMLLGLPFSAATAVGLGLSLSSTAFALQVLAERRELTTRHGRAAFGTLLFQDLAVIPILALLPLLGTDPTAEDDSGGWLHALEVVLVIAGVVIGGHYLLRHVLRLVAWTGIHEVFTATSLLTVIGTALLMEHVGLSMALGAFLAGVLLADSEYRHALEADIEPFKGLLLGLFFIAVGMAVDIRMLVDRPGMIIGLALGLILLKVIVLFVLGRLSGLDNSAARNLALTISQGGEFAFVIFAVAVGAGIMERALSDTLVLVVTMSMAMTPALLSLSDAIMKRLETPTEPTFDPMPEEHNQVIIAGFGRVGQIIARLLSAKKIGFTALESNPTQVDVVRRYGNKTYYGDASRLEVLRAAGAHKAKIFVIAIGDEQTSLRIAEVVSKHFPNLTIHARARNRKHAYRLMDLGVRIIRRETFLSSLDMASHVLQGLGLAKSEAEQAVTRFRQHDEHRLYEHHEMHNDEERMIYLAQQSANELEEIFAEDSAEEMTT